MWIIQKQPKQKCSKCGVIDFTERVSRGSFGNSQEIIRCRKCGHEKIVSKTTSAYLETNQIQSYKLPEFPEQIEF